MGFVWVLLKNIPRPGMPAVMLTPKLFTDLNVREYLQKSLAHASVSRVEIERPANTARVTIHTARPGIVIGKKGEDVEKLRAELTKQMGVPVHINIEEIRKPDIDATLVAQSV